MLKVQLLQHALGAIGSSPTLAHSSPWQGFALRKPENWRSCQERHLKVKVYTSKVIRSVHLCHRRAHLISASIPPRGQPSLSCRMASAAEIAAVMCVDTPAPAAGKKLSASAKKKAAATAGALCVRDALQLLRSHSKSAKQLEAAIAQASGAAPSSRLRAETEPSRVGLKNLGATCYMNSLLQCLFNNTTFRSAVFKWRPPEREEGAPTAAESHPGGRAGSLSSLPRHGQMSGGVWQCGPGGMCRRGSAAASPSFFAPALVPLHSLGETPSIFS